MKLNHIFCPPAFCGFICCCYWLLWTPINVRLHLPVSSHKYSHIVAKKYIKLWSFISMYRSKPLADIVLLAVVYRYYIWSCSVNHIFSLQTVLSSAELSNRAHPLPPPESHTLALGSIAQRLRILRDNIHTSSIQPTMPLCPAQRLPWQTALQPRDGSSHSQTEPKAVQRRCRHAFNTPALGCLSAGWLLTSVHWFFLFFFFFYASPSSVPRPSSSALLSWLYSIPGVVPLSQPWHRPVTTSSLSVIGFKNRSVKLSEAGTSAGYLLITVARTV